MRLFIRLLALLLLHVATDAAASDVARIGVRTGEHAIYSRIVFDWTAPVGVTIEQPQADQLIILFDRPAEFDLGKVRIDKLSRVAALEPVSGQPAVRISLRGAHDHKLTDVGHKVVVDILGGPSDAASAAAGDTKTAAKTDDPGKAAKRQSAPPVPLPIAAAAPDRTVLANKDRPSLFMSSPRGAAARGPFLSVAEPIEPIPDPLFDPAQWRGGDSYLAARAKLTEHILAAPQDPAALLALAQFQFAWRYADEALSVLDTLKARHPAFAARIEVLALRDAAQILAGRPKRLAGVFERTGVRDRPEAQLWRGAAAALSGQVDAAARAFEIGRPALRAYPADFQSFFGLLAMQAAIDAGALEDARVCETIVAGSAPDPDEFAMLEALRGVLLSREHRNDAARRHLLAALRSPALKPQVIARLTLIELDRAAGTLDGKAALAAVEQLYYSWEGDALQLDILEQMVALLTEQNRYDEAFAAAALAQQRFPTDPRADRLARDARTLFGDLLAGEAADRLDPIEAVALYDAHAELRPGGADSTPITLGLARRLAGLDLAAPAVRFYEAALRNAPAAARADIGAELAAYRRAAGDSSGASAATDATQFADAQVRADRYWRDGAWSLAADAYLQAAEGQTEAGSPARARLILRAAAALLLAGKADEVVAVKTKYGPTLAGSPVAALFERITAPDAGVEVLAQPDVSAEIVKRD